MKNCIWAIFEMQLTRTKRQEYDAYRGMQCTLNGETVFLFFFSNNNYMYIIAGVINLLVRVIRHTARARLHWSVARAAYSIAVIV